jgi:SAM-dependent methyltransferase
MRGAERAIPHCPGCGSADARRLGPLPASSLFAGRSLPELLPAGDLYRCQGCALGYRHPRIAKERLDELYSGGTRGVWETSEPGRRVDWSLGAREILARHGPECSVLDIGCFDGAFLSLLGERGEKAGIEIHTGAAARAASAGVKILGSDFDSLRAQPRPFAAITAFDVIEHVENPARLLSLMAGALVPGGTLIFSTGDLDSWNWRLMQNRYWYSAIPEHISFLSERWLRGMLPSAPLELVRVRRFSHASRAPWRTVKETTANLLYRVSPVAARALRRGAAGGRRDGNLNVDYPPCWMSARDHLLVVLRKEAQGSPHGSLSRGGVRPSLE